MLGPWKSKYHNLLNSLNIGYLLIDQNYDCHDVNETFLQMVGGTRNQFVGHNMKDWYPDEEFQALYDYVEPTVANIIKQKPKDQKNTINSNGFFTITTGKKFLF